MNLTLSVFLDSLRMRSAQLAASAILAATAAGCSDSAFNSEDSRKSADSRAAAGEFFKAGKSLDLYVIMDRSGSLFVDPDRRTPNSGSDPECKRFDALMALLGALRGKLINKEDVRLSVVTFNADAELLPVMSDTLSKDDALIREAFRRDVCKQPNQWQGTTIYSKGIKEALDVHQSNVSSGKKYDVETILFFSDGAARDPSPEILKASINSLNQKFPQRVYGVLLGATNDDCTLRNDAGGSLSTRECMIEVAGGAENRLVQVDRAEGLNGALSGLIYK